MTIIILLSQYKKDVETGKHVEKSNRNDKKGLEAKWYGKQLSELEMSGQLK